MFNGKTHYKCPCSIAFCMFTRPGNNRRIFKFSSKPDDRLPNCTPHRIKTRNHQKPSNTCWFHGTSKPENMVKWCKMYHELAFNLRLSHPISVSQKRCRKRGKSLPKKCKSADLLHFTTKSTYFSMASFSSGKRCWRSSQHYTGRRAGNLGVFLWKSCGSCRSP